MSEIVLITSEASAMPPSGHTCKLTRIDGQRLACSRWTPLPTQFKRSASGLAAQAHGLPIAADDDACAGNPVLAVVEEIAVSSAESSMVVAIASRANMVLPILALRSRCWRFAALF